MQINSFNKKNGLEQAKNEKLSTLPRYISCIKMLILNNMNVLDR